MAVTAASRQPPKNVPMMEPVLLVGSAVAVVTAEMPTGGPAVGVSVAAAVSVARLDGVRVVNGE